MGTALWVLAALVLVGLVYQVVGSRRDAVRLPPPGRLVDVGSGRRLHLLEAGRGAPVVVFDAGIGASSLTWARVQPRVAEHTRTCAYDRVGLAWSDGAPGRVTAVSLATDLHALLTAAAIPPPYILVGHSFGSFVVRAFAEAHRDRVAGMVLVDPIYSSEWLEMPRAARRRLRGGAFLLRVGGLLAGVGFVRLCLALLLAGSTALPKGAARMFGPDAATTLRRLAGEVQKLPAELWPAVRAHWSRSKCFSSLARHLAGLPASAAEVKGFSDLGDLPLTVLTGASQPAACRDEHARIAGLSSRGRHVLATTGGHWIHLDEPDLVVRSIRELLRT